MRIPATMVGALFAVMISWQAAHAACSSGMSRTISIGGSYGAHAATGLFQPDQVLRQNEVVLTFDDGPLPGPTTRILRTLDEHCIRATFFIVGGMARANPQLARQIAARGHTIGTHSNSHVNLAQASRARAIREIQNGYSAVNVALGSRRPAPFFRFPYLAETSTLRRFLVNNNSIIFGTPLIDSGDWRGGSGATIRARILSQLAQRGRGVILMHDTKRATARMLPDLLTDLQENGYRIVHLVPSGIVPETLLTRAGRGSGQSSGGGNGLRTLGSAESGDRVISRHSLSLEDVR